MVTLSRQVADVLSMGSHDTFLHYGSSILETLPQYALVEGAPRDGLCCSRHNVHRLGSCGELHALTSACFACGHLRCTAMLKAVIIII